MNDAPPSWVTSTGLIRSDLPSSSYSSVVCTPGMPNVNRTGICSSAYRASHAPVFFEPIFTPPPIVPIASLVMIQTPAVLW